MRHTKLIFKHESLQLSDFIGVWSCPLVASWIASIKTGQVMLLYFSLFWMWIYENHIFELQINMSEIFDPRSVLSTWAVEKATWEKLVFCFIPSFRRSTWLVSSCGSREALIADHRRNLGRVKKLKIETLPIFPICPRPSHRIPDDRGCLRLSVFISRPNLGRSGRKHRNIRSAGIFPTYCDTHATT